MILERVSRQISAQSIEEHERILEDEMTKIKLEYVDRLFSKKIPPLGDTKNAAIDDFCALLIRYTRVLQDLMRFYMFRVEHEGIKWNSGMYGSAEYDFRLKIVEFYQTDRDHWIERTMRLLAEERKKIETMPKENLSADDDFDFDQEKGVAGLVHFNVGEDSYQWFRGLNTDIKYGDVLVSIHLEPLYKQSQGSNNENTFGNLATQIVTRYPETKAVVAQSWVVDSPIGKRIGFNVYKKEGYSDDDSFWGQFINSNGQIDTARVKDFLETGKPPYAIATGAIMTEDFLKKYLPKEYRGKITLRQVDQNFDVENYYFNIRMLADLSTHWSILTKTELQDMFSRSAVIMREFNESNFGEGFFDFLLQLKKEQKTQEQFEKEPQWQSYCKAFREFIKSVKFINKEVNIE